MSKLKAYFGLLNARLDGSEFLRRCYENARYLAFGLQVIGYPVRVVDGSYSIGEGARVTHSWIEYEDQILETDPRQLRELTGDPDDIMPDEPYTILEKALFADRYCEHSLPLENLGVNETEILRNAEALFPRSLAEDIKSA